MNFKEYQQRALLTESKPSELNVDPHALHLLLDTGACTAEILNQVKRTIFYGKPLDKEKLDSLAEDLMEMADALQILSQFMDKKDGMKGVLTDDPAARGIRAENVDLRLLHAAIGIFTEAGEALELVRDQLEGKPFDTVGWGEEIGDLSWYEALGCDAAGIDRDQILQANITKLEKRNKGQQFNAEATINRDTEAERAQLEADLSK